MMRILLRNGTPLGGLTNKLEPEIKKALPNSIVVKKENAAKNDYESTIVIVLDEAAKESGSIIADYLKASVTKLPTDESKPLDADILIIIGKDKI